MKSLLPRVVLVCLAAAACSESPKARPVGPGGVGSGGAGGDSVDAGTFETGGDVGSGGRRHRDAGSSGGSIAEDGGAQNGGSGAVDASTPEDAEAPVGDVHVPPPDATPRVCAPVRNVTVSGTPCHAMAEAICRRQEACHPTYLSLASGDLASCIELTARTTCAKWDVVGQVSPSASDVSTCAAAYANAPCDCTLLETCPAFGPVPGTLADGASCSVGTQCQGGLCSIGAAGGCGQCVAGAGEGDPCVSSSACRVGLTCSTDKRCAVPAARAHVCASTRDCAEGLVCRTGYCLPPVGEPLDCSKDPAVCDLESGYACVAGKCSAVVVADPGGGDSSCGFAGGAVHLCPATHYCDGSGVCQLRGDVGSTCTPGGDPTCKGTLACDGASSECAAVPSLDCNPG
ncbi:MAG TPA: hypothetical protein VHE30_22190 [Polyangiaceae bacterium]|nr:hypothetical protein [Polyangiaceae bacterium]